MAGSDGYSSRWDFKIAFTPLGVFIALTFIGLPFVVRTVQPVLEDLNTEVEEAAASLGATRWQTFRRVILPMLTGFAPREQWRQLKVQAGREVFVHLQKVRVFTENQSVPTDLFQV